MDSYLELNFHDNFVGLAILSAGPRQIIVIPEGSSAKIVYSALMEKRPYKAHLIDETFGYLPCRILEFTHDKNALHLTTELCTQTQETKSSCLQS